MTLLRPAELASVRAALDPLLSDQAIATISRPTKTPDGKGGWTKTDAPFATLRCSYFPMMITPREQEATVTVKAISMWTFLFPAGSDVRPTDKIQIGPRTWEVVGGAERSNELRRAVTAMEIQ